MKIVKSTCLRTWKKMFQIKSSFKAVCNEIDKADNTAIKKNKYQNSEAYTYKIQLKNGTSQHHYAAKE